VSLAFVADVTGFLRGTKDVEDALDDVIESLDDVATQSRATSSTADASLDDISASSQAAAEALEADFRGAFDAVQADARSSSSSISTHVRTGTKDAGAATGEFKQEAKANLSEVASSFQGDFTSAADVVQGTLGGLVSSFGAAGAIGLAAAGVGVGIARSLFQKSREEAAELKKASQEAIEAIAAAYVDAGGKITAASRKASLDRWFADNQKHIEGWRSAAADLGLPFETLVEASQGSADAITQVGGALAGAQAEFDRLVASGLQAGSAENFRAHALEDAINAVTKATGDQGAAFTQGARAGAERLEIIKALGIEEDTTADATDKATDSVEAQTRAHDAAIDKATSYRLGLLDVADAEEALRQAVKDRAKEGLTPQERRDNERDLIALAGTIRDTADATKEQTGSVKEANDVVADGRQKFIDLAEAMGMSREDAKALAAELGIVQDKAAEDYEVKLTASTTDAMRTLNNFLNPAVPYVIDVKINGVVDDYAIQTAVNKVRANVERYLNP